MAVIPENVSVRAIAFSGTYRFRTRFSGWKRRTYLRRVRSEIDARTRFTGVDRVKKKKRVRLRVVRARRAVRFPDIVEITMRRKRVSARVCVVYVYERDVTIAKTLSTI